MGEFYLIRKEVIMEIENKKLSEIPVYEIVEYLVKKQKSLIALKEFGEINAIDINIPLEELKKKYRKACKWAHFKYSEEDLNNSLFLYEGLCLALNDEGYNIPIFKFTRHTYKRF